MSTCKGCGAEIEWIKTPAGKSHPIDVKPKKVWVETADGWILANGHESHFATCPNASQFRSR